MLRYSGFDALGEAINIQNTVSSHKLPFIFRNKGSRLKMRGRKRRKRTKKMDEEKGQR
jgi:hypothetical protein